jgi:radical SAM superfamily enzyme YgiQ (UPF0313 family)
MDIMLIDPPYTSLKGVPSDVGYNIGLTSLAAYLRKGGIETGVIMGDLLMELPPVDGWVASSLESYALMQEEYRATVNNRQHQVWQRLVQYINRYKPAAVGISYLTPLKCSVEMIARLVKEINSDIKVIVGGPHPTLCPNEVIKNPDIDFIINGEGEIPLLKLMREIKNGGSRWERVPGLCYRDSKGNFRKNPVVDLIYDLDSLPIPARDLVLNCDYEKYRVHCILTARGCPYNCAFCADKPMWGGKVRRRSINSVIDEIKYLVNNYKVDMIDILDGTFTYDREYVYKFCKALIDNNLDIKWGCMARYDNIDEEILNLMKRANCVGIFFGLESGSDRVLTNIIDKKTNVQQIMKISEMVYNSGIPTVSSILFGLPDESKEDMDATLKVMKSIKTDIFDISSFVPLPGGRLFDTLTEEEKNIDWSKVGFKSFNNYFSRRVSHEELKAFLSDAFQIADDLRKKTYLRHQANLGLSSS